MSCRLVARRLTTAGLLLVPALLLAAGPAQASGTTLAQCQAAGRAGVAAGSWDSYHCSFFDGGWHLLPE